MTHARTLIAGAGCLLLLAAPIFASDGVLEIHQACVATGCFDGDAAGWPVTIANPGSYRLTSNLALPDENTTGIEITGERVALDLGGFEIAGSTTCVLTTPVPPVEVTCTPTGTGLGIDASAAGWVEVRHGSVVGTGGSGLWIPWGLVERVQVQHAGDRGIDGRADVRASRVFLAGGNGVSAALVADTTVNAVAGFGISGTVIRGNQVTRTKFQGVIAGYGATVTANRILSAGTLGIEAEDGVATILGNSVSESASHGVRCSLVEGPCVVSDNTVVRSGGYGLLLDDVNSGYGGNVLSGNNGGNGNAQVSGGHEIDTNVCGDDTTCP